MFQSVVINTSVEQPTPSQPVKKTTGRIGHTKESFMVDDFKRGEVKSRATGSTVPVTQPKKDNSGYKYFFDRNGRGDNRD